MTSRRPQHSYRALFVQVSEFKWLWSARAISNLGDAAHFVALLWLASQAPTASRGVGAIVFALTTPAVIVGPFIGGLVDRTNRRKLLLTADLVRIFTAAFVPWAYRALGLEGLFVLAFVHSLFGVTFSAALAASIPELVGTRWLMGANGLLATTAQVAQVAGSGLGGLLVAQVGLVIPFWVDAVTFAISASFIFLVPSRSFEVANPGPRSAYLETLKTGLDFARSRYPVLLMIVIGTFATVGFAPAPVALVALARDALRAGSAGYGLLQALITVGLALGGILASQIPPGWSKATIMGLG